MDSRTSILDSVSSTMSSLTGPSGGSMVKSCTASSGLTTSIPQVIGARHGAVPSGCAPDDVALCVEELHGWVAVAVHSRSIARDSVRVEQANRVAVHGLA